MVIKRIPAGIYAANCYLVMDEKSKATVVIDPGGDSDDIISALGKMDADVKYILLTHGHIDHVGAVDELREKYNLPVYINKKDEELIDKGTEVFGRLNKPNIDITDSTELILGEQQITCIETPGHTPGGICFLVGESMFTGDTLFAGSIGRTDFTGGNFSTIIKSIKERLLTLKGNIRVYPGHGLDTTIEREKLSNPFL